jgi:hypothetical protein
MKIGPEEALAYHSCVPAGKLAVVPTGAAVPCLERRRFPSVGRQAAFC